jgi:hypothetical protein
MGDRMSTEQKISQPTTQPIQPTVPKPPPEMEELIQLLTELFVKASELALACVEIGDEDIVKNPALKDLRDSCLETTRIVRKIVRISRKLPR